MTEKQVEKTCKELNKTSFAKMKKDRYILNIPVIYGEDDFIIGQTPARMILPGLAITEVIDVEDKDDHPPKRYCFTHTESGRMLPFGTYKSERSALIRANKCKELKEIDWTLETNKLVLNSRIYYLKFEEIVYFMQK